MVSVLGVENRSMGKSVTVAGLLGAKDIVDKVLERDLPPETLLLVPDIALKEGSETLIDDGTIGEISRGSGLETVAIPSTAREFCLWLGGRFPSLLKKKEKTA